MEIFSMCGSQMGHVGVKFEALWKYKNFHISIFSFRFLKIENKAKLMDNGFIIKV